MSDWTCPVHGGFCWIERMGTEYRGCDECPRNEMFPERDASGDEYPPIVEERVTLPVPPPIRRPSRVRGCLISIGTFVVGIVTIYIILSIFVGGLFVQMDPGVKQTLDCYNFKANTCMMPIP